MVENKVSRRRFLQMIAKGTGLSILASAGVPIFAFATPALKDESPVAEPVRNSIDQYISEEPARLGNLELYNGAKMQMTSQALGYNKNIKLNTHTEWNDETITPPHYEGSVVRTTTGSKILLLHSSYLLKDGYPDELPGELFRATLEGTRLNGFYGDTQIKEVKRKLLLQYPDISITIDGQQEKFYASNIAMLNNQLDQAMENELFKSGDENTLKIFTCGVSAHKAINECEDVLSEDRFTTNTEAIKALQTLRNKNATSQQLSDAVLNTCVDYKPDINGTIVATYMGAKEVIVIEKVNGELKERKVYHNIPKATLESIGIYFYSDRRIIWTLQKL